MFNFIYCSVSHTTVGWAMGDPELEYSVLWPLGPESKILAYSSNIGGATYMLELELLWPGEKEPELEYFHTDEEASARVKEIKLLPYMEQPKYFVELHSGTTLRSAKLP